MLRNGRKADLQALARLRNSREAGVEALARLPAGNQFGPSRLWLLSIAHGWWRQGGRRRRVAVACLRRDRRRGQCGDRGGGIGLAPGVWMRVHAPDRRCLVVPPARNTPRWRRRRAEHRGSSGIHHGMQQLCVSALGQSMRKQPNGRWRFRMALQRTQDQAQPIRRTACALYPRHDERPEPRMSRPAVRNVQRDQRVGLESVAEPDGGRLRGVRIGGVDRVSAQRRDAPLEREGQRLRRYAAREAPECQPAKHHDPRTGVRQARGAQRVLEQPHAAPCERLVARAQAQPLDLTCCGGTREHCASRPRACLRERRSASPPAAPA
jgi:hypothetical protein